MMLAPAQPVTDGSANIPDVGTLALSVDVIFPSDNGKTLNLGRPPRNHGPDHTLLVCLISAPCLRVVSRHFPHPDIAGVRGRSPYLK